MTHFLKVVITEWSTTRSGNDAFPVAVNCGQASVLPGFNLTLYCNPGRENGCSGSSSGSSSGYMSELCRRVLVFRAIRCCSGSARNDFPADGGILAGYIIRWGEKDILLRRWGWVKIGSLHLHHHHHHYYGAVLVQCLAPHYVHIYSFPSCSTHCNNAEDLLMSGDQVY